MRSEILLDSLGNAWAEAERLMGPDARQWRWGILHQADFKPALPISGREAERRVGPFPIGGSGTTPNATSWTSDYKFASGPSVRLVMDVGAWDNSVVINNPGQSGDPSSPHYRDLFPLWASGRYVPFAWTRARVLQEAEHVIKVMPAR
jgi:penicillin amidase